MSNPLNDIAPYPRTADEATADGLLRHETVTAYAHLGETRALCRAAFRPSATDADKRRYFDAEMNLAQRFAVLFVLRQMKNQVSAEAADEIARGLHAAWDDGGSFGEFLFDWLVEHGIDPGAVERAVTETEAAA